MAGDPGVVRHWWKPLSGRVGAEIGGPILAPHRVPPPGRDKRWAAGLGDPRTLLSVPQTSLARENLPRLRAQGAGEPRFLN